MTGTWITDGLEVAGEVITFLQTNVVIWGPIVLTLAVSQIPKVVRALKSAGR